MSPPSLDSTSDSLTERRACAYGNCNLVCHYRYAPHAFLRAGRNRSGAGRSERCKIREISEKVCNPVGVVKLQFRLAAAEKLFKRLFKVFVYKIKPCVENFNHLVQKIDSELEYLQQRISEEYGEDYEGCLKYKADDYDASSAAA